MNLKEETKTNTERAVKEGLLLDSTGQNLEGYFNIDSLPKWMTSSIEELVEKEEWGELNDRFYKNLAFGTGGMRGRTIGKVITLAELGNSKKGETPHHPAVGTNNLNEITVIRATKALYLYVKQWLAEEGILEQPRLVVAHDVRHFSVRFSKLVAFTWSELGGYAMKFDGPRSTPQLSFSVRNRYAHAGVVITASHNPYHDNGFKAYFDDGAQLIPPHADSVVTRYEKIFVSELVPLLEKFEGKKNWSELQTSDDLLYRAALEDAVLDPEMLKSNAPKIVFTPIHGTGAIASIPALWDHGVEVAVVDEQNLQDPNFSTVKSPNPENPEALKLGISVARKTKSDLVLGSDPDCDRIGVAARKKNGSFDCLSGNQIACMLAEYRLSALKRKQLLNEESNKGFAILKTFVTSHLLSKISTCHGVRCVNTPTGFKWMAKKLRKYEEEASLEMKEKEGVGLDYDDTDLFARIEILSKYSTCVALAAEESYGYLPLDLVRDKDGNASALSIAELFAYLKSIKSSAEDFLNTIYLKHGYHLEKTENIYFEGAQGSETITRLANSYRSEPFKKIDTIAVKKTQDFLIPGVIDEDEDPLPQENFIIMQLENGFSVAIRPSGTEPKIKYYLFGCGDKNPADLEKSKEEVNEKVNSLANWLLTDAKRRAEESN